jgi:peptide/nickel transport system substrate-binding protein
MGSWVRTLPQPRNGRPRRLLGAAMAAATGLALTAGCSSGSGPSEGGHTGGAGSPGGKLVLGTIAQLPSFDPYNGITGTYVIEQTLYSHLINYDKNRKARPDLATSWKFAADHRSVVIKLRNADFSDGTPVTSADIVAGVKRAQGADGLTQNGVASFIKSVTPVDAHTVKLAFAQPTAEDTVLDWMFFFPVVEAAKNTPEKLQTAAAGSGPFMLKSYSPNKSIVMVSNPHYYKQGEPKLDSLEVKFFGDQNAMISALQTGAINAAQFVSPQLLGPLKNGGFQVIQGSLSAQTPQLYLNPTIPPFTSAACRKAVMRAIDRKKILKVAQGGAGYVVPGPFTKGSAGYDPAALDQRGFDLAAARAGIRSSCSPNSATAVVTEGDPYVAITMQILQADLKSAGFTLKLEHQDTATFVSALHAGKTAMASYPTVNPFLSIASLVTNRSFSPTNTNYWWGKRGVPAEYVSAVNAVRQAITAAQIKAAAAKFNKALADQSWVVGLFTLADYFVVSKKVSGFDVNAADMVILADTSVQ